MTRTQSRTSESEAGRAGADADWRTTLTPLAAYEAALRAGDAQTEDDRGKRRELAIARWTGSPSAEDLALLGMCRAPTLDVGCGPGRFCAALTRRGVPALGVDVSGEAVQLAKARGALALRRDVFLPLPGEGRWHNVLISDGNIGIGADPVELLRRAHALLRLGGTAVVDVGLSPGGVQRRKLRLHVRGRMSSWFSWAEVGADAVPALARVAGFEVLVLHAVAGRAVAVLGRR